MSFFSNLSTLFGEQAQKQAQANKSSTTTKSKEASKSKTSHSKSGVRQVPPTPLKSKKKTKSQNKKQSHTTDASKNSRPTKAQSKRANQIISQANSQAKEIILEAKNEAISIKSKAEDEANRLNQKLEDKQKFLDSKLSRIEERLNTIDKKEERLDKKRQELDQLEGKITKKEDEVIGKLENVANLTTQEAKDQLLADLQKRLSKEMAQFVRQKQEEAQQEADDKVQEIIVDAMKHGATDYVAEYTVSTVQLPSEDIKGKIIGKSGRNIHAFERITGVDVDLDADPKSVRLSSFDPVRREIARIALKRLIKDGRIQPTRIEEIVNKVRKEIDKITFEAGKQLCHDVGVYNLPNDLMKMLGKFKYRFSYGQNLIAHTLEETRIGIKLAHELKADVNTVKLGCLLHDVGKISPEADGSHVELGVKIAKKFNLPQAVIDCIAQHHEDEPFTGPEQMLVYIADAISGARPGARYENYDEYVERLEKLEEIATGYEEVAEAYAIQAGREVRVILKPEKSKDDDVTVLAGKIRDEIKDNLTYPGTVTVTVIRETRTQSIAK